MFILKRDAVLIFSKTNGYRRQSIEAGIAGIEKMVDKNNFNVAATGDSLSLTGETPAK